MSLFKNSRRLRTAKVSSVQRGGAAEGVASDYLQARGLKLVCRNYRCRLGEMDLIMRDGQNLVFIEVRSRSSTSFGNPAETVTRTKQKRLLRTAAHYLQKNNFAGPCRFDVIAITRSGETQDLEWIKDAFQAY